MHLERVIKSPAEQPFLSVERYIKEIITASTRLHPRQGQTGIQPLPNLERQHGIHSPCLHIIPIQILID